MLNLHVITVSTREGRQGPAVAQWFCAAAAGHGAFAVTPVDLAEVNLPLFDEPNHPRLHQYRHEHTLRWSAIVAAADAFVFVTPEYNYGAPPSLLNALDYLYREWHYKPAAFVSYGGVSGGTRSVQMAKQVMTTLRMMPIPEAVNIPFFSQHLDDTGAFAATDAQEKAAHDLLAELHRWTVALQTLR